ncbi:MAG: GxxExxY protein [Bacteroidales bacterium]|nr:GxxExxY protein [Bacteroidales bacterium]
MFCKINEAHIISYLKLADKRLGFLINFNVPLLKDGFFRKVNYFFSNKSV